MSDENNRIDIVYKKTKEFIIQLQNKDNKLEELPFWLKIGTKVAELVDKFKDIDGIEKKQLVMRVMELIIDDKNIILDMKNDARNHIKALIKLTLPTTIDLIIKATKGEIEINKKCNFLCFSCTM